MYKKIRFFADTTGPIQVMLNPHLTSTEKILFQWIKNLCQGSDGCWASNRYLAGLIGRSEQTVINGIQKLICYKYIIATYQPLPDGGTERHIYIDDSYLARYRRAVEHYIDNDQNTLNVNFQKEHRRLFAVAQTEIISDILKFFHRNHQEVKNNKTNLPSNADHKKIYGGEENDDQKANSDHKIFYTKGTNTGSSNFSGIISEYEQSSYSEMIPSKLEQSRENRDSSSSSDGVISDDKLGDKLDDKLKGENEASKPPARKLTRITMHASERRTAIRSIFGCPSLAEEASKGIAATMQKLHGGNGSRRKALSRIPYEHLDLMDIWRSYGFRVPDREKAPAGFNNTVRSLKKIQNGTLIPGEMRKFSIDDIRKSMAKFSLLVSSSEYGIANEEARKSMSMVSLGDFFYAPFKRSENKSWFLKCHDSPPLEKRISEGSIENKFPAITKRIQSFYCDYVLAGFEKKFTQNEENKFREAANRVCMIYDKYRRDFAGINGYSEMADVLCLAIRHTYGEQTTKVMPGSFCSSFGISRMIAYMNEKGYIPDASAQINI